MRFCLVLALSLTMSALYVTAQTDVYDNGPTNGTVDAWTINFGFAVSDTFTLRLYSGKRLNFAAWLFPGDVLQSAEVSMTSSEFGGTTYFDGTVNFTQSGCITNQLGFSLCNETGSFSCGEPECRHLLAEPAERGRQHRRSVYWDENSGPSQASESSVGTIPSESFTVLGNGTTTTTAATPEPATVMYLFSGLFGAGCVLWRKLW